MPRFYDAFISYGRADSKAFAVELNQRLVQAGLDIWFDFEDIPLGVDYQNQIDDGIERAHNFLFVISPHAVNSPYCRKEIELAIACGKRIIPLLHVERISRATWQQRFPQGTEAEWHAYVDKGLHESYANMHPHISKINWVYCREGLDDFEAALSALHEIFARQQPYVEQHTALLTQAHTWERHQRQGQYLLVGDARQEAEAWLLTQFDQVQPPCMPTELQCEFISESTKNAHNLMTDVLLSYAETDRATMMAVRSHLWRAGFTVWTNKTDIASGEDFQQAIERGIEATSTVVFLLSAAALASPYCQHELAYALSLHKRLIPLLVEALEPAALPPALRAVQYIDLSPALAPTDYAQQQRHLLKILRQDASYYDTHKHLLTQALKWERQARNPSILLRGHNLRQGESWLHLAQRQAPTTATGPTPLQIEFLEESLRQPPATALDVFLSYSRVDSGLARKINDALQMQGKTTWFDQESIAAGSADFQREIELGIEAADNFVFLLSPAAIASPYCADEVAYAAQLHKRIVTVLAQPIDPAQLPPPLAKVQWLDFTTVAADFNGVFSQLVRVLDTDREHVHSHTKWSQQALEWQAKDQTEDLLLRGTELAIAQQWLQTAIEQGKRPAPTALQTTFIEASVALRERLHQAAEAQRQRELTQAQQLAAAAEAQRQAEVEARLQAEQRAAQEAKARRISQRITLLTGIGAPLLSVLVLAIAVTGRASQVDKIERLAIAAESHLRDEQPFDALVASTQAGLQLKGMWLFPPRQLQGQIDGVLRQAAQDVRERHRLETADTAWSVDGSPDGQRLAIATQDGTVQLWEATHQRSIPLLQGDAPVYQVFFATDGQSVFTVTDGQPLQRWSLSGELVQTFGTAADGITKATLSADGQWLAAGQGDGTVAVWTASGQLQQTLVPPVAPSDPEGTYLFDVSISPDKRYVAAARADGVVHLWDVVADRYQSLRHPGGAIAARFTPDGTTLITASDYTLHQWSLTGEELRQVPLAELIYDIDIATDGARVAVAHGDGTLRWVDLTTGTVTDPLPGHEDAVNQVHISADQRTLISASSDRTVRLWDLTPPATPALTLPPEAVIKDVRLEADGGYVLAMAPDHTVTLWDLAGNAIAPLDPGGTLRGASFSPQHDLLATGTDTGIVSLWDLTGKLRHRFQAHTADVVGLRFSPDGQTLVTTSADQTATLWDLQGNAQANFSGHGGWVSHASYHPHGGVIATTGHDGIANIWLPDGTLKHQLTGHQDWVLASAFSADGQYLATGSSDRTVKLWDVAQGSLVRTLEGHRGGVTDIVFVDDTHLVTASGDGTARLWNTTGTELTQYRLYNTDIHLVRLSADGKFLVTIAQDSTARLWQIDAFDTLLRQACQRLQPYLAQSERLPPRDRRRCDRWLQTPPS